MNLFAYLLPTILLSCMILGPVTLVWALRRWWKSDEARFQNPTLKNWLALAAFCGAGISLLLWFALGLWALLRGGFPFYDPTLLTCITWGLLIGCGGFAIGLIGKGKLRWPACFISLAAVLMWLLTASME